MHWGPAASPCCLSPLRPGPRCLALRDTWLPPPGWGAPWGQGSSLCPIPQTQGLVLVGGGNQGLLGERSAAHLSPIPVPSRPGGRGGAGRPGEASQDGGAPRPAEGPQPHQFHRPSLRAAVWLGVERGTSPVQFTHWPPGGSVHRVARPQSPGKPWAGLWAAGP